MTDIDLFMENIRAKNRNIGFGFEPWCTHVTQAEMSWDINKNLHIYIISKTKMMSWCSKNTISLFHRDKRDSNFVIGPN